MSEQPKDPEVDLEANPEAEDAVRDLVKRARERAKLRESETPAAAPAPSARAVADDDDDVGADSDAEGSDVNSLDDVELKDALRDALRPPEGSVAPSLLRGVQRKLRVRSRGKFYGDGWSTASSPRSTYLITSVLMLALMALVVFVLIPWSSSGLP